MALKTLRKSKGRADCLSSSVIMTEGPLLRHRNMDNTWVYFIELDGFKGVNEGLGRHGAEASNLR